jgi:sortase (surface protein transpeptidase)
LRERLSRLSKNQRRGLLSAALVLVVGAGVAAYLLLQGEPQPPQRVSTAPQPEPQPREIDRPAPAAKKKKEREKEPQRRLRVRIDKNAAAPVGITVPRRDIAAPVIALGLLPNGKLEVPKDFADAGWRANGPEPGERGAALITAHVDSRAGPAAFFHLRDIRRGDRIRVRRRDRTTVTFIAERMERVPKTGFPTKRVYGKTRLPTLRLVTCTGAFIPARRTYRDNLIVYATRAPS